MAASKTVNPLSHIKITHKLLKDWEKMAYSCQESVISNVYLAFGYRVQKVATDSLRIVFF